MKFLLIILLSTTTALNPILGRKQFITGLLASNVLSNNNDNNKYEYNIMEYKRQIRENTNYVDTHLYQGDVSYEKLMSLIQENKKIAIVIEEQSKQLLEDKSREQTFIVKQMKQKQEDDKHDHEKFLKQQEDERKDYYNEGFVI